MRTRKSTVTFQKPFIVNPNVGELSAGSYDIEIDEEEICATDRVSYLRTAIYLYVQEGASTRTVAATPKELDFALERDREAQRPTLDEVCSSSKGIHCFGASGEPATDPCRQ